MVVMRCLCNELDSFIVPYSCFAVAATCCDQVQMLSEVTADYVVLVGISTISQ